MAVTGAGYDGEAKEDSMITKSGFLEMCRREAGICRHLHGKIDESKLEWKPGENMRTTLELLRYLTYTGIAPAQATVENDWETAKGWADKAKDMTAAEFPARMDDQVRHLEKLLEPIPDDDLMNREVALPWGENTTLGGALVATTLRFLAAYRMQLFLYVKASGVSDIGPANCWAGIDMPPPAAED